MENYKRHSNRGVIALCAGIIIVAGITAFVVSMGRTEVRSRGIIERYLHSYTIRKLQIGAGYNNFAGWLNTDITPQKGQAYLDASKRFPVPDGTFRYVFSEHVIEHLTYEGGMVMLKESYRVLEPGGKVRIATPNLLKFVDLFKEDKTAEEKNYIEGKLKWHDWPHTGAPECIILNMQLLSFGHQFVYDPATMRRRLEEAGFQQIKQLRVGESDDPELKSLEARTKSKFSELNNYETMVFEAVRP